MKKFQISALIFVLPLIVFGQFNEIKNLSEPRGNISTVIFGDSILFVGGSESNIVDFLSVSDCQITSEEYGSDGFTSSRVLQNERYAVFYELTGVNSSARNMYVYDNVNKEWYSEKYPNGAFQDIENGYVESDDIMVFIDNDDNEAFYTYNLLTKEWATISSPFSRRETTIIDVGEKIFFIGGKESFTTRSDSVHVYDKTNSIWNSFILSEAKNGVTAIQYEDKVVIAGGQSSNVNANSSVDLVEIIDIDDYSIETINLSEKKNDLIGIIVGNKVIFAGGNSQNAEVINMDDYSLATQDFDVNQDLEYLNGGVVGDMAIFAGGNNVDGNQVFVYNNDMELWSSFTIDGARSNMAFASVGNKLFAAGGEIVFGNEEFDEIYIIENISTSIFDIGGRDESIEIYPNPTSRLLNIVTNSQPINKVVITDMNGRIITNINFQSKKIDLSPLNSGAYFLLIYTDNKVTATKFIKN